MTDQEYIKMILALDKEVFEDWEWKEGDKLLINAGIKGYPDWIIDTIGNIQIYCRKLYHVLDRNVFDINNVIKWNILKNEVRPYPSQEQLQKMVNLTPAEYIDDLYDYSNEPAPEDADFSIFYIDMKCFTLAYVMDRKYGKYWNGASWEKTK